MASNIMVGTIIKTAVEDKHIFPTPLDGRNSDNPSGDGLFEAADMSQRSESYMSETDSETDSESYIVGPS